MHRPFEEHRACDDATLQELVRTPKMQMILKAHERWRSSPRHHAGRPTTSRRDVTPPSRPSNPPTVPEQQHEPPLPPSYGSYDRKRLYEEVWTESTQRVAERYGVSDVAIAKACRKLKIAKPPRGYWAKKATGATVPAKPPLPDF